MTAPGIPTTPHPELDELIAVLEQLRAPGGCAGTASRPTQSLVQYLVEETYELVDAIESGDSAELVEELGDVLYQVIFHADIAAEAGRFTLEDVAAHMTREDGRPTPARVRRAVAPTPRMTWSPTGRSSRRSRSRTARACSTGSRRGCRASRSPTRSLGRAAKVGVDAGEPGGSGDRGGARRAVARDRGRRPRAGPRLRARAASRDPTSGG